MQIAGREVQITNPDKVFFPAAGYTKGDLLDYYLAVAEGAVRGVSNRPMALKRFVQGAGGEAFFQKRAPANRPPWIDTAVLSFPSGRTAEEIVVRDAAQLAWVINLGCIDLNPHPTRSDDLDHPDELRIDLDPMPGVPWSQVRDVALAAKRVLDDMGLTGWPKTSGSRGMHIYCRIERRWTHPEVRRAAVAFAREVERRAPTIATSKWWKEERHGVFLDYNQNAKDRTVSTPLHWDEVPDCVPEAFTLATVPARFAAIGDPGAGIDAEAGSLEALLELAAREEADGLPDAPWPPNYPRQPGEAPRVQPSRARARSGAVPPAAPGQEAGPTGRRRTTVPLLEIARARTEKEAREGLERWKSRHPEAVPPLEPADVLVDAMRGRSSAWYRIRVNLTHVPADKRPPQELLEIDYDPWAAYRGKR